jgi:DNA-binding NarL/FixJ family response regulator
VAILICSDNIELIEKCKRSLTPGYCIKAVKSLDAKLDAEAIIIDPQSADNQTLEAIQVKHSNIPVLLIGSQQSDATQLQAILNGIAGYIDLTEPDQLLQKAIYHILQGDIWINRHLVPKLIRTLIDTQKDHEPDPEKTNNMALLNSLSTREMEVAQMISSGDNNKKIAAALNISERTVKAHLTSIFKKVNVPDRLHLALLMKETA